MADKENKGTRRGRPASAGTTAPPQPGRAPRTLESVSLRSIEDAARRIATAALRTPLVRLEPPDAPCELWLKLECLQPIGSFKLRGAANAMALADPDALRRGVYTGSAGNMAQGVAFVARRMGVPCRVIVPDSAPKAKLDRVARLGATAVPVPFDDWWAVLRNHRHPGEQGVFIHPVSNADVIAGNGTVGLEILADLPDVEAIVVPFGGGGLSCGIAIAAKALEPSVRVFAAEVSTAAPLRASLRAGGPVDIVREPSFVDGIGGAGLLPEMWPLASKLLDGSIVVSPTEICAAIRALVSDARVVAEGAGAAAVAAALSGGAGHGKVVAVVSGGNIDADVLATILGGGIPG